MTRIRVPGLRIPGIRVAHIIDSLRMGGAQQLLVTFAGLAPAWQMETTVLSLYADKDAVITEALKSWGAVVASFPGRRLFSPGRFWRLVRYLRIAQLDLVHTHLTYANSLGVLAGRLAELPVVSSLHSTGHAGHRLHPAAEALERWSLRFFASRVIAVGTTVAEAYRAGLGKKEIFLIPNAVGEPAVLTPQERLALRREIAGDAQRPILISVGRLIPAKAYEDLIRAFAVVHAAHPQAFLAILGDGPLSASLHQQVQRLGLQPHVCLPGTRQDVARWLAAADLYVSSSIWEGLPLSVLEAMMAGLPVVATQVGDLARVVGPQVGRVVPPGRPEELAGAIEALLADPASCGRMGTAAQAQAMREYAADVWMERLTGLYGQLAPGRQPASLASAGDRPQEGRR